MPKEKVEEMSKVFLGGFLLGINAGAYTVSDEWNKLSGGHKFVGVEELLQSFWGGRE